MCAYLLGRWGSDEPLEERSEEDGNLDSDFDALRIRPMLIATIGVGDSHIAKFDRYPSQDNTAPYHVDVGGVLVNRMRQIETIKAIRYYSQLYHGKKYAICDYKTVDEITGEYMLTEIDVEVLNDCMVRNPIQVALSMYKPISALRRQDGIWAEITTDIMAIRKHKMTPILAIRDQSHMTKRTTFVVTDSRNMAADLKRIYDPTVIASRLASIDPNATIYIVSSQYPYPSTHIYSTHLAKCSAIVPEHVIAGYSYTPADDGDLKYDDD